MRKEDDNLQRSNQQEQLIEIIAKKDREKLKKLDQEKENQKV